MSLIIYTAFTRGYDALAEIPISFWTGQAVAFIEEDISALSWTTAPLHTKYSDPCRNAKIHKILSHRYFPDAEYSLWIDGSISICFEGKFSALIEDWLGTNDIAVFCHRTRNCIYQEALACLRQKKDDRATIERQMAQYAQENYPRNAGLVECSVLLRRHTPDIKRFNEAWWQEICRGSRRDQLSFNYVAQKLNIKYRTFSGIINQNSFFHRKVHLAADSKLER